LFCFLVCLRPREREREACFGEAIIIIIIRVFFGEGLSVDEGSSSVLEDAKQIVLHL
jgi:hypothetical protein